MIVKHYYKNDDFIAKGLCTTAAVFKNQILTSLREFTGIHLLLCAKSIFLQTVFNYSVKSTSEGFAVYF